MSKETIELLKSALEIVIKNPDLDVEITFKTKDNQVKAVTKNKVAKKDIDKKSIEPDKVEKPKAGSGTVDEFDAAISKPEEKKAETKIEPDPKNTGEKKIIPKDNIGDVEAATEEEPKKVILPVGEKYCVACGGTGIGSKGQKCVPCKGTGIEQSKSPDNTKAPGKIVETEGAKSIDEKKSDVSKSEGKKNDDDDWVF